MTKTRTLNDISLRATSLPASSFVIDAIGPTTGTVPQTPIRETPDVKHVKLILLRRVEEPTTRRRHASPAKEIALFKARASCESRELLSRVACCRRDDRFGSMSSGSSDFARGIATSEFNARKFETKRVIRFYRRARSRRHAAHARGRVSSTRSSIADPRREETPRCEMLSITDGINRSMACRSSVSPLPSLYISCGGCRLRFARVFTFCQRNRRRAARKAAFTLPDTGAIYYRVLVAPAATTIPHVCFASLFSRPETGAGASSAAKAVDPLAPKGQQILSCRRSSRTR